jgi:hypothetical protein
MPDIAILVRDENGEIVARTRANASGAFRVGLPPGTYILTEEDKYAPQAVTVEPGNYVTVILTFDVI